MNCGVIEGLRVDSLPEAAVLMQETDGLLDKIRMLHLSDQKALDWLNEPVCDGSMLTQIGQFTTIKNGGGLKMQRRWMDLHKYDQNVRPKQSLEPIN